MRALVPMAEEYRPRPYYALPPYHTMRAPARACGGLWLFFGRGLQAFAVFGGAAAVFFAEGLDKVAHAGKADVQPDLDDLFVRVQQLCRFFEAVVDEVLHGRGVQIFFEERRAAALAHGARGGDLAQRQLFAEMFLYKT